jgi:hypothetical protein
MPNGENSMSATLGRTLLAVSGAVLAAFGGVAISAKAANVSDPPGQIKKYSAWLSGDFHQHTYYTDGSTPFDFVMEKSNEYGLDWWTNSEHGGGRNRNGDGMFWDTLNPPVTILGNVASSGGHRVMWRWQSLRDFVFPDILRTRDLYPSKRVFSGLEWNVPGHEHCGTAIVGDDASAISAFEYQFDKSDTDTSRNGEETRYGTLTKQNGRNPSTQATKSSGNERHLDAVAACSWMQKQYDAGAIDNAWIIFAHIERAGVFKPGSSDGGYNIEHFRDFNNAAPDVCFGFEGAPGHQVNDFRGFGNTVSCSAGGTCTSSDFGGTYGGVGFYTAKVGGLWDALLGEGRRWFNYANSDYHKHYTNCSDGGCGDDFYPGEYQKTWVRAFDANGDGDYSLNEIADGLRSGNAYFVHGDLIDHLDFTAGNGNKSVPMGGEVHEQGTIKNLTLTIKFKSPAENNCRVDGQFITRCADSKVDHIDLIAGEITGRVDPKDPSYTNATNASAKVIASFSPKSWQTDKEGYNTIVYHMKDVTKNMYFRLRGTNLACGTTDETGPATSLPSADYCAPLADALVTKNTNGQIDLAQEAWDDLWFYSNPIFVYVK